MTLPDILKRAGTVLAKNSPGILTGLGILGFGTTIFLTGKSSASIKRIHDSHVWERDDIRLTCKDEKDRKELTKADILAETKELAPLCLPIGGMAAVSVACFLGATKINLDRQAAIMAAYSLSERTLTAYQAKVIEKLGEDVHKDILDESMRETVPERALPGLEPETIVVPQGMTRCYDNVTGRYFFASKEKIMAAESEINKRLLTETRIPLIEFYYLMGVEEGFVLGESMGWDISSHYVQNLNVWFTSMLDDEKNPCLVLNYHVTMFERGV